MHVAAFSRSYFCAHAVAPLRIVVVFQGARVTMILFMLVVPFLAASLSLFREWISICDCHYSIWVAFRFCNATCMRKVSGRDHKNVKLDFVEPLVGLRGDNLIIKLAGIYVRADFTSLRRVHLRRN